MKLSIIVPVFNAEKYIDKCLDTLVHQTFIDFELIIVNDGSTDSSRDVIEKYKNMDKRIKVINKKNGGIISAVREGILHSKGEYVGFVDADDFSALNKYERLICLANQHKCDVVACSVRGENFVTHCPAKKGYYNKTAIEKKIMKNFYTLGGLCCRYNKIIKRRLLVNNLCFYNGNIQNNEDYLFHTSYFFDVSSIYITDEVLCNIRTFSSINSTTKKNRSNLFKECLSLYTLLNSIYKKKGREQLFPQTKTIYYNSIKASIIALSRSLSKKSAIYEIKQIGDSNLCRWCIKKLSWKYYTNVSHFKDRILCFLIKLRLYNIIYYLCR